ncbi:nitrate- and nitrite sensing domain-containing protein [Streptomyces sp. NPDC058579]|uniref:sensor histidine kinase n=1 Tax=Streptomyces sp. NPDC058579 TaxID=3346548 RepID=UPI003645FE70
MALWAYATVTTATGVSELSRVQEANSTLLKPIDSLVASLQAERAGALRHLAAPSTERAESQGGLEKDTDAASAALRRGAQASTLDVQAVGADFSGRVDQLLADLDGLTALRKQARASDDAWQNVYDAYGRVIEHGFAVQGALAALHEPEHSSPARVVLELAWAREMIAREDALMGAAQASDRFSREQYQEFVGSAHTQRRLLAAVDDLPPADAAAYRTVLNGSAMRELRATEDRMRAAGGASAAGRLAGSVEWKASADAVLQQLGAAQTKVSTAAIDATSPVSFAVLGGSGVAVALGLLGVLLSLFISVRIGRGLVRELTDLRNSALTLAGRELPETIRKLHTGETVDLDVLAPLRAHRDDEVGQVGAALVAVHRAAVTSAAERAQVLHGISGVYVNLARRSQALLHRQLALLDTMERRNDDPVELEDLFRLDHLTTRMRRHSESLIILSGAAPGRGWRQPVPLMDVVRSAVAEVEDFRRVEVHAVPEVRVHGAAVADLIHLLAELVENATAFSPPHTVVRVRGERVGSGVAFEIEDRGLGMSTEGFAEANSRIEDTGRIDLLDSGQLGLFVVNRLAHRLDARVSLQPSVYGGVVAVILLPTALISEVAPDTAGDDAGLPSRRPERRPPVQAAARSGGRHRAPAPPTAEPVVGRQQPERPAPTAQEAPVPPVAPTPSAAPPLPDVAPVPPVTGVPPQPPELPGAPTPGGKAALPRRVRQQSGPGAADGVVDPDTYAPPVADGPRRSPEQARAAMTSFRAGWARGNADRVPRPGTAHGDNTEREGESR